MIDNSGKYKDGEEAKAMSQKHETAIGNIQNLCRLRGEQLARLEASVEMMLDSQKNLADMHSETNKKIDALSIAVINLASRNGG